MKKKVEDYKKRVEELTKQKDEAIASANAISGAITILKEIIADLEKSEESKDEIAEEVK